MPDTCCTATTAAGQPCRAHPCPGRPFCALHDPELADTIAEGRSKGGAAPRRRSRRLPPILDHLLRIYAPLTPEVAALLDADLSAVSTPAPSTAAAESNALSSLPREELRTPGDLHACLEALSSFPFLPEPAPIASVLALVPAPAAGAEPNPASSIHHPTCEQVPEQVLNRCPTGLPATETTPVLTPSDSPAPPEPALSTADVPEPANSPDASPDPAGSAAAPPVTRYFPAWPAGPSSPVGSPGPGFSPFR
jgi:hypothetical protein